MKKQILDKYAILYGALTALIIGSMVLWEDIFLFLYVNDRLPLWMMDMNRAMVVWHNEICLILWPGAGCFGKETRNTGLCYGRWVYVAVQHDCRQWLVDAFSIGYQLFSQGFLCDGVCASLVLFSGWPCTAVFEKKAQKERRENWT